MSLPLDLYNEVLVVRESTQEETKLVGMHLAEEFQSGYTMYHLGCLHEIRYRLRHDFVAPIVTHEELFSTFCSFLCPTKINEEQAAAILYQIRDNRNISSSTDRYRELHHIFFALSMNTSSAPWSFEEGIPEDRLPFKPSAVVIVKEQWVVIHPDDSTFISNGCSTSSHLFEVYLDKYP